MAFEGFVMFRKIQADSHRKLRLHQAPVSNRFCDTGVPLHQIFRTNHAVPRYRLLYCDPPYSKSIPIPTWCHCLCFSLARGLFRLRIQHLQTSGMPVRQTQFESNHPDRVCLWMCHREQVYVQDWLKTSCAFPDLVRLHVF